MREYIYLFSDKYYLLGNSSYLIPGPFPPPLQSIKLSWKQGNNPCESREVFT